MNEEIAGSLPPARGEQATAEPSTGGAGEESARPSGPEVRGCPSGRPADQGTSSPELTADLNAVVRQIGEERAALSSRWHTRVDGDRPRPSPTRP